MGEFDMPFDEINKVSFAERRDSQAEGFEWVEFKKDEPEEQPVDDIATYRFHVIEEFIVTKEDLERMLIHSAELSDELCSPDVSIQKLQEALIASGMTLETFYREVQEECCPCTAHRVNAVGVSFSNV